MRTGAGSEAGAARRAPAVGCALALLLAAGAGSARAAAPVGPPEPGWWLRLGSTGYVFQTEEASGATLDRFAAYQTFDGAAVGLAGGRLAVRASGRVADDLSLEERTTERGRLYTGFLEGRLGRRVTARLGRQFVQEGAAGLTLDGLHATLRGGRAWDAAVWAGARAPLTREFEAGDLGDDAALGFRVLARPERRLRVGASWAYRESSGKVVARPLGVEGTVALLPTLRATGRAGYDLESESWERAEATARWTPGGGLPTVSAQVLDRRPSVDAGSYFARFAAAAGRVRLVRVGVRHEDPARFGAEIEYVGAFVEERTSARVGGALLVPGGRLGYSARVGDMGEEGRWYGDLSVRVARWLRAEAGATFTTYALFEDAPESEERDLTTAFGRLRATPRPGLGVTVEVQSLENPVSSEDVRLLAGLDLVMGRGGGRFGLDRRGGAR